MQTVFLYLTTSTPYLTSGAAVGYTYIHTNKSVTIFFSNPSGGGGTKNGVYYLLPHANNWCQRWSTHIFTHPSGGGYNKGRACYLLTRRGVLPHSNNWCQQWSMHIFTHPRGGGGYNMSRVSYLLTRRGGIVPH